MVYCIIHVWYKIYRDKPVDAKALEKSYPFLARLCSTSVEYVRSDKKGQSGGSDTIGARWGGTKAKSDHRAPPQLKAW